MKKILFLFALSLVACSSPEEPIATPQPEVITPNYDSLVGKEVIILTEDGWSDWSMWNEERTKSQGHIFAGETSTILEAKIIQGSLRYKVTNSKGESGFILADVCKTM
ncbi:MAG: hypothetical protein QNL40_04135 [Flavobacteriales bacterium]